MERFKVLEALCSAPHNVAVPSLIKIHVCNLSCTLLSYISVHFPALIKNIFHCWSWWNPVIFSNELFLMKTYFSPLCMILLFTFVWYKATPFPGLVKENSLCFEIVFQKQNVLKGIFAFGRITYKRERYYEMFLIRSNGNSNRYVRIFFRFIFICSVVEYFKRNISPYARYKQKYLNREPLYF